MRPHRWQPTRLSCPWDSPGKNTGVGCHFLLQCMKVKGESEVAQSCPAVSDPMDCSPPGSSVHRIFQARELEWGATAFSGRGPEGTLNRTFFSLSLPSMIVPKGYRFEATFRWSAHIVPAGETTGISTPGANAVMILS